MKKHVFYTEFAYLLGVLFLALGCALMEAADYGVSMVVAPAYLLYLKLSQSFSFFTFGMAEYTLQAVLLIIMIVILRRFKVSYLFSFVTALLYGFVLDGTMFLVAQIPSETTVSRILFYLCGLLCCAAGVSFMFHTYIEPEVYELIVKEVSARFGWNIHKFKTWYDCISCVVGIVMSFLFFGIGKFEGVKAGTIICAIINGWLISRFTHFFDAHFDFVDGLRKPRKQESV